MDFSLTTSSDYGSLLHGEGEAIFIHIRLMIKLEFIMTMDLRKSVIMISTSMDRLTFWKTGARLMQS